MGRKAIYTKLRINGIENQIAMWELTGYDEWAQGLRVFFEYVISEDKIEAEKAAFVKAVPELAENYTPNPELTRYME